MTPCRLNVLTVLALLLQLLGCKSESTPQALDLGGADANQIGVLIDELNDARGDAKKLTKLFAPGSAIPEVKKFSQYDYSLAGKPSVSGDSATCSVRLDHVKGDKVEKEWTFVKVGDQWKVKAAVMP